MKVALNTIKQTLKKGRVYKQIKQSKTTHLANPENKTSTVTSRNLCPKLGQAQKCGYWVTIIQTGRRNEDLEIQKCVRCEVKNMFSFVCLQSYIHTWFFLNLWFLIIKQ